MIWTQVGLGIWLLNFIMAAIDPPHTMIRKFMVYVLGPICLMGDIIWLLA